LIDEGINGAIDDNLFEACRRAMSCERERARQSSHHYTLRASHQTFFSHLVPVTRRLPVQASVQASAGSILLG
jgi:hypothetical protein